MQVHLASALAQLSRYAEAGLHFEATLALDPEPADAHFHVALTLHSLGRTAGANGHYQEAVRLNPGLAR
ncbi:Tetratricopeptide repeat-containing protein [Opitutus sp. GAS368]|nr:tetratricopeptide repeat protein [Opitutus sp. GAS368]SDR65859.1 Tetratricopeptide repeat-containing protein [Opitutus sp. GAS368]